MLARVATALRACVRQPTTVVTMPGSDAARSSDDPSDLASAADVERVAEVAAAAPDLLLPLGAADGTPRQLAADLVGEPGAPGAPTVLLVHGTPDSRLARHPDPAVTSAAGVRLVAVDRPGFGHSTPDPGGDATTFAADAVHLLDHLALDRVDVLAWSAGASWALAVGAVAPARVRSITIVGGLVPFEALMPSTDDPAVRAAAGEARLGMVDTAAELGPQLAAEMIGPLLVPDPATPAAALEHRRSGGSGTGLDTVPGAEAQMAAALLDAVRQGTEGLVHDLAAQFSPTPFDLGAVRPPVRLVTGERDTTCPPAFAHWFAAHLPDAWVEVVPDAGHDLLLVHWTELLQGLRTGAVR